MNLQVDLRLSLHKSNNQKILTSNFAHHALMYCRGAVTNLHIKKSNKKNFLRKSDKNVSSDAKWPKEFLRLNKQLPVLELSDGFWERAGRLRSKILARGLKSRLVDALVAQVA